MPDHKPDLDDGYLKIAHELFAVVACAGFSKWEMIVIRETLDQIFGPRKLATAKLSPTEIAGRVGTFKQSLVRAIRSLIDANVLIKTESGEFRFNLKYDTWVDGTNARFTDKEMEYCGAAKRRNTSTNMGNNSAYPSTNMGNNGASAGKHGRFPTEAPALPEGNTGASLKSVPPGPPIEERVRDEKNNNLKQGEEPKTTTPLSSTPSGLEPEYMAVARRAEEMGGDCAWALWVSNMGKCGHPAKLIMRALEESAGAGKLTMGYVAAKLRAWAVNPPPAEKGGGGYSKAPKPREPAVNGADRVHIARSYTVVGPGPPRQEPKPIEPERPKIVPHGKSKEQQMRELAEWKAARAKGVAT